MTYTVSGGALNSAQPQPPVVAENFGLEEGGSAVRPPSLGDAGGIEYRREWSRSGRQPSIANKAKTKTLNHICKSFQMTNTGVSILISKTQQVKRCLTIHC